MLQTLISQICNPPLTFLGRLVLTLFSIYNALCLVEYSIRFLIDSYSHQFGNTPINSFKHLTILTTNTLQLSTHYNTLLFS